MLQRIVIQEAVVLVYLAPTIDLALLISDPKSFSIAKLTSHWFAS
jgi:hypothetical protein